MLGRTANGLFWMFRYLERAENSARMLDAGFRLALTRDRASAEAEWSSVIETLALGPQFEAKYPSYTGMQVRNFILRDRDNPSSILRLFGHARENARMVRNTISSDLWEAINDGWLRMNEQLLRPVGEGRVGEVVANILRASLQAHGALAGSMLRNEGFHFASAGTFIERGDNIARILNIKYYLLLPSLSYVGSSLDTGQWDTILRAVSGGRAFRWINAGKIDSRGICEFLILDRRFPRSLAFCHSMLCEHLEALAMLHGGQGKTSALKLAEDSRLATRRIDEVFEQGLHEFLVGRIASNRAIGEAIAEDYRFHI